MSSTLKVDILQDSGGNNLVTSNGSGVITAAGFGKIGQVVSVFKDDVFSTTSTSFVDVTDLSQSITPSSTSSKILIQFSGLLSQAVNHTFLLNIVRGSTNIAQPDAGSFPSSIKWYGGGQTTTGAATCAFMFIDSPATTSATTYKITAKVDAGTGYIGRLQNNSNFTGTSSLTLMEILP